MGVMSIRLNSKEEGILKYLIDYLEQDKSTIIKNILVEKFEDLQDMGVIEKFESRAAKNSISFHSADDILNDL